MTLATKEISGQIPSRVSANRTKRSIYFFDVLLGATTRCINTANKITVSNRSARLNA